MLSRSHRRRRPTALLLIVAWLLAGCGQRSRVDPDAKVQVGGVARAVNGAALAGRPVRMGSGVSAGDATFAVLTAGLACTAGICHGRVFDTTTDDAGAYAFDLKGRDTQSTFGEARSQLVSVSAPPTGKQVSGPSASARFVVQTAAVKLPVLQLIDPRLALTPRGGKDLAANWSTPAPGPYKLTYETASPVPVWATTTDLSHADVDARVLEGTTGRAVVSGGSQDRVEGSKVELRWRSPGVAYAAPRSLPVSRGRTCTYTRDGQPTGQRPAPCGLTDGEMSIRATTPLTCASPSSSPAPATPSPAALPSSPCPEPNEAVIDLGAAVPADLVVIRGCTGGCAVDTSADGTTFRPAGAVDNDYGSLRLDGQPIRSVRVHFSSADLREVSVWEPTRGESGVESPTGRALDRLRAPFDVGDPADSGRRRVFVIALGCVLLVAVIGGLAFLAGRRSRRRG